MIAQLSSREKTLVIGVGTVVFLFVNFFVIDYIRKNKTTLDLDLSRQTAQLRAIKARSSEKEKWEQRETWLTAKQPKLVNDDSAGVQLLERVKEVARKHDATLENPSIRVAARRPDVTAISVDVDVKSPWKGLIAFLNELQQPDQFVVLEKTNLKIDTADQTRMHGKFTIAKWYAAK